jgi:GntR family transcriptional repressor for pyruvate dehydrogenase complex
MFARLIQRGKVTVHWAIVAAVKNGQGMQTERAMREHLDEVEKILFGNHK